MKVEKKSKRSRRSSLNLNFTNYKFIRNDSITLAGGVGLYIKESLKFTLRKDLSLNLQHCEDLWIEAVMGFKILRTGSFLYRTYQQQVPSFPAMGFKILRTGFPFPSCL